MPVIFKWGRFEQKFKSSVDYSNAVHQATLTVTFTSPLGETSSVAGFWDGGKTWRVRFAPNELGQWTFKTSCSDFVNKGLNGRRGNFICTAAAGFSRFERHGPVRVAADHRHFEHADRTPFFWMADAAWAGARLSDPNAWEVYSVIRADQDFTAVEWSVSPGEDAGKQWAYYFRGGSMMINPAFFQRLDAKVDALKHAGLLSVLAPISELGDPPWGMTLPEADATLLVRYIVARYGADPVAWLLAVNGENREKIVGRWKRIGQAAFGEGAHAPVILYPGETPAVLDAFRDQGWVDAFGYSSVTDVTDDAFKQTLTGPFASEWKKDPAHPLIPFAPTENSVGEQSKKRFSAEDVRQAVYTSLLMAPPAGVSYGADAVANWNSVARATTSKERKRLPATAWPLWEKSLFLSGGKELKNLGAAMSLMDFWQLRPNQSLVATQPGDSSPRRSIVAAATDSKALEVVYVPEDRTVDLSTDALPPSPLITWLNPRTGQISPAVAVVGGAVCQFPTPDAGDWLLVIKAGK